MINGEAQFAIEIIEIGPGVYVAAMFENIAYPNRKVWAMRQRTVGRSEFEAIANISPADDVDVFIHDGSGGVVWPCSS